LIHATKPIKIRNLKTAVALYRNSKSVKRQEETVPSLNSSHDDEPIVWVYSNMKKLGFYFVCDL
jgi:hypothetical protein